MTDSAPRIRVLQEDITRLAIDAIVNAANSTLLGGGGVDGAIHRAAGPELRAHCATLGGCPTGEARITPAFRLPARYIIHTVGPVWHGGRHGEAELLAACYRHSLALAAANAVASIAFPSISTGVYRFPLERACRIALHEVRTFLAAHPLPERVIFCCFSAADLAVYRQAYRELTNQP